MLGVDVHECKRERKGQIMQAAVQIVIRNTLVMLATVVLILNS